MPGMIWAAIIVELGIQNWLDACLLLAIQFANATIGWYETTKAGDAVAALKASLRPTATAKRDGRWGNLDAALLVPGDLVLLGSGSAVPADCIVNEGQIDVDQAALTGESLPVTMRAGDSVKMGSTVVRGEVEASVEFTGKDTFFGKTATMIQATGGMGNLQKLLWHIMVILLALSFTLCLSSFAFLMGTGIPFKESLEVSGTSTPRPCCPHRECSVTDAMRMPWWYVPYPYHMVGTYARHRQGTLARGCCAPNPKSLS